MFERFTVIILPGRGGSDEHHWQSHWKKLYSDFLWLRQEEWDHPRCEDWLNVLNAAIQQAGKPVILIAHSLSVSLVAHWATRFTGNVAGALLVAPSDVESPDYLPGTEGFAPQPDQKLPFPSIVVASTNDPKVTFARAEKFAQSWGSNFVNAGEHGHMGSADRLQEWPFGQQQLAALVRQAGENSA